MFGHERNRLAVTLWFLSGSLALSLVIVAYSFLFDPAAVQRGAVFWLQTTVRVSGFGAMSGLMVDALRLVASVFWPARRPSALDVNEFLRRNLAG